MARTHARVNMGIWNDDDFRALPPAAQHLYFVLWTHPALSYCGVVDWRVGRIASRSGGWTVEEVQAAADCLEARHFIVTDSVTEECLVRSWIRFDGLIKEPKISASMALAFATAESADIRQVIVYELRKLHHLEPDAAGWKRPQVAELLTMTSLNPKERTTPTDPFTHTVRGGFTPTVRVEVSRAEGQSQTNGKGSVKVPPTPSPTPSPLLQDEEPVDSVSLFDEFYDAYPRHDGVDAARKRWATVTKAADPREIIEAAKAFRALCEREGTARKYIALPATWLNAGRWKDEALVRAAAEPRYDSMGFLL